MKTNVKSEHPHRLEISPSGGGETLILDFFQMRVTKDRDPNYNLCLSRSMISRRERERVF